MKFKIFAVLTACVLLSTMALSQTSKPGSTQSKTLGEKRANHGLLRAYGKLPLSFELNQGQTNPQVKFLSRGAGTNCFSPARRRLS